MSPLRSAASIPVLGAAPQRRLEVRASQPVVADVRREDGVEPGVDLPDDEPAEPMRDPPARRRRVSGLPGRVPDGVPVEDVADPAERSGAASACARRSSRRLGVAASTSVNRPRASASSAPTPTAQATWACIALNRKTAHRPRSRAGGR